MVPPKLEIPLSIGQLKANPIQDILSALTKKSLVGLAREFNVPLDGKKQDLIARFLTSYAPIQMILENIKRDDLIIICKSLRISPIPRNRLDLINLIYKKTLERFPNNDLIECLGPKYQFIRSLGEGGQGKVLLAREALTGRIVAVKYTQLPEIASVLHKELKILASLDHRNIERLYTFELPPKYPNSLFLILEYCAGITIGDIISQRKEQLSWEDKIAIIRQALDGLSYFHSKQVVHGDISSSNIIISPPIKRYDNWLLKYIDFGASRVGFEPITTTIRNERYSAPELKYGPPTLSSDVFSLTVVIAEFLGKIFLFDNEQQKNDFSFINNKVRKFLPEEYANLLIQGLHVDPIMRIKNGRGLNDLWQSTLNKIQNSNI